MPPTLADRLAHILEAIHGIEELLAGKSPADLVHDRHLRLALEREYEIISEASRKIPDDIKAGPTELDWPSMAALGNRLRHAYHRVDVDVLFSIARDDLPPLKEFVVRILREEKRSP